MPMQMSPDEKKELYKRLGNLDSNLQRVLYILESDEKTNNKGLVEKVNETRYDVDAILLREKIFKTKAGIYGGLGAAIVGFFLWIVNIFVTK